MHKFAKQSIVLFLAVAFVVVAVAPPVIGAENKLDEEPGAGKMMADMFFLRPVGVLATAVGSLFFLVSLPFSASGGNTEAVGEKLVKEPARYTFQRPLGDF